MCVCACGGGGVIAEGKAEQAHGLTLTFIYPGNSCVEQTRSFVAMLLYTHKVTHLGAVPL